MQSTSGGDADLRATGGDVSSRGGKANDCSRGTGRDDGPGRRGSYDSASRGCHDRHCRQ